MATRFIDVLREDPRGLPLPVVLNVTLSSGVKRRIGGKKLSGGRYTLEYTTQVCDGCKSGWMNDIDSAAYPVIAEMIRGHCVALNHDAQASVSAWIAKVAVTARSAPYDPLPIEPEWTSYLYSHHSPPPSWDVWVGRYGGSRPWWYRPDDVRIELRPGSGPPPPGFLRQNGVLATLAIGYLFLQVFGVSGPGQIVGEETTLPRIWPVQLTSVNWPPLGHIDDAGLPLWAERLLHTKRP